MSKSIAATLFILCNIALFVPTAKAETAIAPEVSPPGDIPDNQAFVSFTSPLGYSLKVPEGWARKDDGAKTIYQDKYNHILIQQGEAPPVLDEFFAKSTLIPDLQKSGRAVEKVTARTVLLKSGNVLALEYESNSEPNAVTNKQVREENERLYFVKDKKLVTITLSAPKGADNVDQWLFMANSFRWK